MFKWLREVMGSPWSVDGCAAELEVTGNVVVAAGAVITVAAGFVVLVVSARRPVRLW